MNLQPEYIRLKKNFPVGPNKEPLGKWKKWEKSEEQLDPAEIVSAGSLWFQRGQWTVKCVNFLMISLLSRKMKEPLWLRSNKMFEINEEILRQAGEKTWLVQIKGKAGKDKDTKYGRWRLKL
jgi:hypothetical protein